MALHYKVRFTVTDKAAYTATEDGVWFEFLDENGDALATMSANITQLEDGFPCAKRFAGRTERSSQNRDPCAPITAGQRNAMKPTN